MPNVYDTGDLVRLLCAFADEDDEDVDPTTVTFKFTDPLGDTTEYTYDVDPEVDPELVRSSKGHYHVDISIDKAGAWYYRWESTGTGQAAEEDTFEVRASRIAPVA